MADVLCRLVALPGNDTAPAPLFDWTSCSVPAVQLQTTVALAGLLALSSGSYAVQAYAVDAAGNEGEVAQAVFTVDTTLPLTPTATVAALNVTLAPEATSTATTQFYYITAITNGALTLSDGVTAVTNGSFVGVADGAAGLLFVPTPALFSGDSRGSLFGFSVQARVCDA